MKKVYYGPLAALLLSGVFVASCAKDDFFVGGRCEVDADCNSWSQQAEGTICVSGQCVCADPDKYVDCAPGEEGCRPACIPRECSDLCLALPPAEWSAPVLVWTGAPDLVPGCPDIAPLERYRGFANPSADAIDCPACECEDAATTCQIATDWTAFTGPSCSGAATSFAAPGGWDGTCTAVNAVTGTMESLSVPAPAAISAGACASKTGPVPPRPPTAWGNAVVACEPPTYGRCGTGFCVAPPPTSEWQACVLREGDRTCPDGYPTRSVFYDTADDARACTPCSCGAPSGGACAVLATAYAGSTCSGQPIFTTLVTSSFDACNGLVTNTGIGSKSATVASITPATCTPAGGAPTGTVAPTGPTTVCCAE